MIDSKKAPVLAASSYKTLSESAATDYAQQVEQMDKFADQDGVDPLAGTFGGPPSPDAAAVRAEQGEEKHRPQDERLHEALEKESERMFGKGFPIAMPVRIHGRGE